MRLTSSRAYSRPIGVPKMPPGLVELMEGLTKDVLKNNPTRIYEFCANHLEKLIDIRDGPSSKKTLSLEQKISIAQEKVRKRAIERQQRYDIETGEQAKINNCEKVPEEIQKSPEPDIIPYRAPVYHDQDLSLASEVEVSHEPLTNYSIASRDSNINESDDIAISKSSTYSSVSKSTVIDLGNENEIDNREEMNSETGISENKAYSNEKSIDIGNDLEVEIAKSDIESCLENLSEFDVLENIETTVTNNGRQRESKEVSDLNVSVEDRVFDRALVDSHIQEKLSEKPSIVLIEREHVVQLKSLDEVDVIIEEEDENIVNIEIDQSEISSAEQKTDLAIPVNGVEEYLIENKEHNRANDGPNASLPSDKRLSGTNFENMHITKISNIETDKDVIELLDVAVHSIKTIPDTSNGDILDDTISEVKDNTDLNPNEVLNVTLNGSGTLLGVPDSEILGESKNNRHEIKPKADPDVNINVVNETDVIGDVTEPTAVPNLNRNLVIEIEVFNTHTTPRNEVIENDHNSGTEDLSAIVENDHNLDNNAYTVAEEQNGNKTSLDNTSATLPRSGSTENNDDSSVIESDLSKAEAEDDLSRSDNQNDQTNMDLETAAVTIQKVFRSFLFKSRNSTFEDITNDDTSYLEDDDKKEEYYAAAANVSKERRPLGITRMDTVLQTVNEEKSLSLSTDDSSTLSSAATTIQAHVRGFLVRNKLNSYKTVSTNSLVNSNEILDDTEHKNKTVLNIHIVPEQSNYLSRDESLITSMELSLDGSPPSSVNLHPLSYDISERRKLLKREDAIQSISISPPSNNSGKLSEDSVKEVLLSENDITTKTESNIEMENNSLETMTALTAVTIRDSPSEQDGFETVSERRKMSMNKTSSDESDVITPFEVLGSPRSLVGDFENTSKLVHSGEFHDVVLPTKVSRSDTTVVREFKNVLAYILLWNNS